MEKEKNIFSRISKKSWIMCALVLLVAVIIIALLLNFDNKQNDNKDVSDKTPEVNDSADIVKEATYEGLTINNVILMTTDSSSTFTATVTNNTEETKTINDFGIVLKKGDTRVTTIYAYLGDELQAGESKEISASTNIKLTEDVVDNVEYRMYE